MLAKCSAVWEAENLGELQSSEWQFCTKITERRKIGKIKNCEIIGQPQCFKSEHWNCF